MLFLLWIVVPRLRPDNWLGVNDTTACVDNLIEFIGEGITRLKYMISLEEILAELERAFGFLPDEDN